MLKIQKTIPFPDLKTKPEITGMPELSEAMQQTLALLSAFDGAMRRLLLCSESGVLFACGPRSQQCKRYVAISDNENYQPAEQVCSECLVRAGPANVDKVYVQVDYTATTTQAWPLDANDWVKVSPSNMKNIHILFAKTGDVVYFFPTR